MIDIVPSAKEELQALIFLISLCTFLVLWGRSQ